MNKLTPYLIVFTLIFVSCSTNQNEDLATTTSENLLQSYTLKRDANGAYSIDFNTLDNTDVATVKNIDNSNEIILSETNYKTGTKHSNYFNIEKNQLKIGFLEANRGRRTRISVEDDNITLAKGITEFLNSYSITANEDGTYILSFEVNNNVTSEFLYNEDIETYEVHLSKGNSKQKKFTRNLIMNSDDLFRLNFVNHKYSAKNKLETTVNKPKIIYQIN